MVVFEKANGVRETSTLYILNSGPSAGSTFKKYVYKI